MNKLKLKLLGNIQIVYNEKDITNLLSSKSIALISYLSFYKETKHKRNKIIELLWGNSQDSSAKYNLRYNLWSINKIIKKISSTKLITSETEKIYINDNMEISTDLDDLLSIDNKIKKSQYKIEELIKNKEKFKELFLDGIYIKECFEFNDWIYNKREEFQKIYYLILKLLLEYYDKNSLFENCINILKELLQINPYNEENYIEIIKYNIKLNNKKNAFLYYNKCVNIFREELNISPTEYLLQWEDIIKKSSYFRDKKEYKINIEITNERKKNAIEIECFPDRLKYSFLYEFSNKLFQLDSISKDKKLWNDIVCINPSIYFNEKPYFFNEDIFKIRLFNSFISLIEIFAQKNDFNLLIKNFHFIDSVSFEFFKYLIFSNKVKGTIFLLNTIKCNELSDIEKYVIIKK